MKRAGGEGAARVDFVCQRSGRCCRVPDGVAFVDEGEVAALAGELGLGVDAFAERYVRSRVDPRTGAPRLALRDRPDGACILLDGDNACRAYRARPKACVDFPFWRDVLTEAGAFERATTTCPGLVVWPAGAARKQALAELAKVLAGAPKPQACPFAAEGDGPDVTGLELEQLAEAVGRGALEPRPASAHPCLLAEQGRCSAPEAAPLACRSGCGPATDARDPGDTLEAFATARDALEAAAPWPRRRGPLRAAWNRRFDPRAQPLRPPPAEMG